MLDKQLYALVFGLLAQECPKRGLDRLLFSQRYQPTQEGIDDPTTIYMTKVGPDRRYGWRGVRNVPKVAPEVGMTRIERQDKETTLQFSVTQPLDISLTGRTHSDTLNIVAAVVQSPDYLKALIANKASVLRVTDIRMAQVINDKGQWEENPSFDAVFKHEDVFIDGIQQVTTFEFNLYAL